MSYNNFTNNSINLPPVKILVIYKSSSSSYIRIVESYDPVIKSFDFPKYFIHDISLLPPFF